MSAPTTDPVVLIPADLEVEDRIVGPVTFRLAGWLAATAGGAALAVLSWPDLTRTAVGAVLVVVGVVGGFWRPGSRPVAWWARPLWSFRARRGDLLADSSTMSRPAPADATLAPAAAPAASAPASPQPGSPPAPVAPAHRGNRRRPAGTNTTTTNTTDPTDPTQVTATAAAGPPMTPGADDTTGPLAGAAGRVRATRRRGRQQRVAPTPGYGAAALQAAFVLTVSLGAGVAVGLRLAHPGAHANHPAPTPTPVVTAVPTPLPPDPYGPEPYGDGTACYEVTRVTVLPCPMTAVHGAGSPAAGSAADPATGPAAGHAGIAVATDQVDDVVG